MTVKELVNVTLNDNDISNAAAGHISAPLFPCTQRCRKNGYFTVRLPVTGLRVSALPAGTESNCENLTHKDMQKESDFGPKNSCLFSIKTFIPLWMTKYGGILQVWLRG